MNAASIVDVAFRSSFERFCALVEAKSGHPFQGAVADARARWGGSRMTLFAVVPVPAALDDVL